MNKVNCEILEASGYLPSLIVRFIEVFSRTNIELGGRGYLVGGAVRDLLMSVKTLDFDFTSTVDLDLLIASLERKSSRDLSILLVSKSKYLTAKCEVSRLSQTDIGTVEKIVIDLAQLRHDYYPTPGKAPEVRSGDLTEDAQRRDFSVNALMLEIQPKAGTDVEFEIVDMVGGVSDISNKIIRVLHDKSFEDDPARLIRAVRFMVRYGFYFDEQTEILFASAIQKDCIRALPLPRLMDELGKAFTEADARQVLTMLFELGVIPSYFEMEPCSGNSLIMPPEIKDSIVSVATTFLLNIPESHRKKAMGAWNIDRQTKLAISNSLQP